MRLVRAFSWGYAYIVWNWPVWSWSFLRWNHEDSAGVRVRLGFLKAQVFRQKAPTRIRKRRASCPHDNYA